MLDIRNLKISSFVYNETYMTSYFNHFRRARENKGMLTKLGVEKKLLRSEIFDRVKSGQIYYTPKGDYLPVGFKTLPKI